MAFSKTNSINSLAFAVRLRAHDVVAGLGLCLALVFACINTTQAQEDLDLDLGVDKFYVLGMECESIRPNASPTSLSHYRLGRCWIDADYLLWSIDKNAIPALVTTSPNGIPSNLAGILNSPSTSTLVGSEFGRPSQSGFKIGLRGLLDVDQQNGYELTYRGLPTQSQRSTFDSNEIPTLARPVFGTVTAQEVANLVAFPGVLSGRIAVNASSELHFVDALIRERWTSGTTSKVDALVGYRYGNLHETLSIDQTSQFLVGQGQIVQGTTKSISDRFETSNQFHGATMGLEYQEKWRASLISVRASLSFGMNQMKADISGNTVNSVPGGGQASFDGGLLAQATNIGTYSERKLVAIPELTVRLQRHLTRNCQINVGYNLLYWNEAARPGVLMDRRVSQFPPEIPTGSRSPSFAFHKDGTLIQGLQTGLILSF
jgi:hypothetical protein